MSYSKFIKLGATLSLVAFSLTAGPARASEYCADLRADKQRILNKTKELSMQAELLDQLKDKLGSKEAAVYGSGLETVAGLVVVGVLLTPPTRGGTFVENALESISTMPVFSVLGAAALIDGGLNFRFNVKDIKLIREQIDKERMKLKDLLADAGVANDLAWIEQRMRDGHCDE